MICSDRGFSLLEVLVALAVIGIGMSAALSMTSNNINTLSEIEKRTYAHWVSENVLSEMKLDLIQKSSSMEGREVMVGRDWFWSAEIKPTRDNDVMQIHLSVSLEPDAGSIVSSVAYMSSVQ